MNYISLLIMAANLLDKQERDSDHGYACPVRPQSKSFSSSRDFPAHQRRRKLKRTHSVSVSSTRTSHNELEKNRRAHMKHCFEVLKKVVPLDGSSSKHTTQGLLISARQLILNLNAKAEAYLQEKNSELNKIAALRERLALAQRQRQSQPEDSWSSYRRSYSESSGSSNISISPTSETEHVDVVGLGSTPALDSYVTSSNKSQIVVGKYKNNKNSLLKPLNGIACISSGSRSRAESSSSPTDLDDSRSQTSIDSGCGLSPVSKIALDGL